MIEIKSLIEIILVTLIIKLIVTQWTPPIQRSLCAILSIVLGSTLGYIIQPNIEGLIGGVIGSGFAFYGGELLQAFKIVTKDLDDFKDDVRK